MVVDVIIKSTSGGGSSSSSNIGRIDFDHGFRLVANTPNTRRW